MPHIVGATIAKVDFARLVAKATETGEPIHTVRFNKPFAVLVSCDTWQALNDRVDELEEKLKGDVE